MKTQNLLGFLSAKSHLRKIFLMLADIFLITSSYLLSWLILMRRIDLAEYYTTLVLSGACFVAIFFFVFLFFGMYGSLWRFAEAYEFIKCLLASIVSAGIFVAVTWVWLQPPYVPSRVPITVYFLSSMMAGISTLFLRMGYRAYRATRIGRIKSSDMKRVIIIGAGQTGNAVLQDL